MKFLILNRIEGGQPECVAASAIVGLRADTEATWVTLASGSKFLVTEFVEDIVDALGGEIVIAKKCTRCRQPISEACRHDEC